jgi:thiamine-phosphate pyrophosphorylase
MSAPRPDHRCRIVLVAPAINDPDTQAGLVGTALSGGDVASVIVIARDADERLAQARVAAVAKVAHPYDVAVIVAGEARVAMRAGADGLHLEAPGAAELAQAVEAAGGKIAVGADGARSRHDALELGEARPDYLFFGRFGYDTAPDPHPRNLALGEWWSQMVAIPCIVQAGADWRGVATIAATGAEFVALSTAVFAGEADPAEIVANANALLDAEAPRLEGAA